MSGAVDPSSATEFGYQLAVLSRRWRKRLDDALASSGLTDASWRPLVHLARLGDGARQNDLARSLGIEGPSLVRLLDRLESAKLIERREDASDRRAKTLHLTPEGEDLAERLRAVVGDACGAMVAGVSAAEIETCARVFARLTQRLDAGERS